MAGKRLLSEVFVLLLLVFTELNHGLPCTLVNKQLEYDLSTLAAQDHWRVRETQHTGEAEMVIYLSLCHPLRGAPSGCAGNGTGVCIVEESSEGTENVTVPNAGRVPSSGLRIPQGQLMLEYVMEDGIPCPQARGEIYRTYINFLCAQTSEDNTGPVLMSSSRCQLLFAWMTQAACPRRLDVINTTHCSIQFPSSQVNTSGLQLHLQTLRAKQFHSSASAQPQRKYEINICGPVVNGSCNGKDVAVCLMPEGGSPKVMATTQDMNVRWEENTTLVLAYQASDEGQNVEVKFTCHRGTADTEVNYVRQNDTTVIFSVRTSAVCPPTPTPRCVLEDHVGKVYDLRPLHRMQDNWEVLQSTSDGQVGLIARSYIFIL